MRKLIIALVLMLCSGCLSCANNSMFNVNDIKMVTPKQFEMVKPADKKRVAQENVFLFEKVKKDWKPLGNPVSIDEIKLNKENRQAMAFINRQNNRTKYSAWGIFPLLDKQLNAYLITNNEKHLNDFVTFYEYFLSVRMDKKGRENYAGILLPQWERLDRYNIL